jgi:hypothetical protein
VNLAHLLLPALSIALLAACGSTPVDDSPPPETNRMQPDHAPTPFSAKRIRAGCRSGRTSTYRIERRGEAAVLQTFRFGNADEKGVTLEVTVRREDGTTIGSPRTTRESWKGFQSHASYPAAATKITVESIRTPAGSFDCWLYTVDRGEGKMTRAWFAQKLPGPPVWMIESAGGKDVFTMTLIENFAP